MLTPTDVKVIPARNVLRTEMEMEVTIVEEEYLEIESGVREMGHVHTAFLPPNVAQQPSV